jgi:S1-C subfamily serine protease
MDKNNTDKKVFYLTLAAAIFFILFAGLSGFTAFFYFDSNQKIQNMDIDLNSKVSSLKDNIVDASSNLKELQEETSGLKNKFSLDIGNLEKNQDALQKRNQEEIMAINSLIGEIQNQSNIKLEEIKDELKIVKVSSKDFTAIIDKVIRSIVSVNTNKGQGSGVAIGEGLIVTNYHVVDSATKIKILTYDRNLHDGILIGFDEPFDIAIIKIDSDVKTLKFDDSDKIKVGERVIALGNPAGLSFTVTEGIVSAVNRKGPNGRSVYIQTDVPINRGNSGGPLVNANGKIIGINNFKIGGYEGLGFALESNIVKDVLEKIIKEAGQTQ